MKLAFLAVLAVSCAHSTSTTDMSTTTLSIETVDKPQTSRKDLFTRLAKSSVRVWTEHGMGSGTVIATTKTRSLILTCAHVIKDDTEGVINMDEEGAPEFRTYPFAVLKKDVGLDLALLVAAGDLKAPAVPIAKTPPDDYESLYIVASPLGQQRQAAEEILCTRDLQNHNYTFTGIVLPGMSGGGLVDAEGALVCVVQAGEVIERPNKVRQFVDVNGECIALEKIRQFLKA